MRNALQILDFVFFTPHEDIFHQHPNDIKHFPHVAEFQSFNAKKTLRQRAVMESPFREKNAPRF